MKSSNMNNNIIHNAKMLKTKIMKSSVLNYVKLLDFILDLITA